MMLHQKKKKQQVKEKQKANIEIYNKVDKW